MIRISQLIKHYFLTITVFEWKKYDDYKGIYEINVLTLKPAHFRINREAVDADAAAPAVYHQVFDRPKK